MSVVIPPGFGQAAWYLNAPAGTQPFIFTVGLDLSDVGGDYVAAANQAFDAWSVALEDETSDALTLERVLLAVGQDGGDTPSVSSSRSPNSGTRSSGSEPLAIALLVNKTTAQLGRTGRGRCFIPGVVGTNNVDLSGVIQDSFRSDAQAFMDSFANVLTSGASLTEPLSMPAVLLHSEGSGDNTDPTPITGFSVSSKVGVLRKRLR